MKFSIVVDRLNTLIEKGKSVLATECIDEEVSNKKNKSTKLDLVDFISFRTSVLYFLETTIGTENSYYKEFDNRCTMAAPVHVKIGLGLLSALNDEFHSRWLWSTKGIVSAELLSDFLDMAEHLLDNNYKDASAVMIGSVLEEHLRRLCEANAVEVTYEKDGKQIPKKADVLNSALAGIPVYNKLDQKWVTASLDLRNKAAHGHYEEYTKEQVKLLLSGVIDFISRHPY